MGVSTPARPFFTFHPGMSYEDGVQAAMHYLLEGYEGDDPFDDETLDEINHSGPRLARKGGPIPFL